MSKRLLVVALLSALSALAQPAVPTKVNFTARLVDNGVAVTGTRNFSFALYPTLVGGNPVWTETRNNVTVTDGAVNVDLGAATPLTDAILDGQTLYLEVTVGTQALAPRTALLSAPYAIRSTVAARLGALQETDVQRRVTGACAAGFAVRSINADGTVVCAALGDGGTGSGGTITGVIAGNGLTGGGSSGNVSLQVSFAGGGSATTAARSDHGHSYLPVGANLGCTGGDKVVSIDPISGNITCGADLNSGGTVTAITAGTGLTGGTISGSGTIGLATSVQNWSAMPSCATGSYLRSIGAGGVATCEPVPAPVTASSTGGLQIATSGGTGSGPTIGLVTTGCPSGATMRFNGSSWGCIADVISVSAPSPADGGAPSGIVVSNPNGPNVQLALAPTVPNWTTPPQCPANRVLKGISSDGTPNCVGPVPVDWYFNLSFMAGATSFAHLWVTCLDGNGACTTTVPSSYAFGSNATTSTVTVTRTSVGAYTVNIPWMSGGVPQVTAYGGDGSIFCKVSSWGGAFSPATGSNVYVICFDTTP